MLTGPGLGTWDFSVLKDTHLFERLNLQFRAEIFNILNRTNLNTPNLIVFTSAGRDCASVSRGRNFYANFHNFKAGAIRPEIAVVRFEERHTLRTVQQHRLERGRARTDRKSVLRFRFLFVLARNALRAFLRFTVLKL